MTCSDIVLGDLVATRLGGSGVARQEKRERGGAAWRPAADRLGEAAQLDRRGREWSKRRGGAREGKNAILPVDVTFLIFGCSRCMRLSTNAISSLQIPTIRMSLA